MVVDNGYCALTDLCETFDIIAVEEHWLTPYNLDKLRKFNAQFDCICSSTHDKIQPGLNTGRPFGGIRILFNKTRVFDLWNIGHTQYQKQYQPTPCRFFLLVFDCQF